jgi:hypothetical protein
VLRIAGRRSASVRLTCRVGALLFCRAHCAGHLRPACDALSQARSLPLKHGKSPGDLYYVTRPTFSLTASRHETPDTSRDTHPRRPAAARRRCVTDRSPTVKISVRLPGQASAPNPGLPIAKPQSGHPASMATVAETTPTVDQTTPPRDHSTTVTRGSVPRDRPAPPTTADRPQAPSRAWITCRSRQILTGTAT